MDFTVPVTTAAGPLRARVTSDFDALRPAGLWSFFTLRPARGFIGAVAVEGIGWRLRQRRWRLRLA